MILGVDHPDTLEATGNLVATFSAQGSWIKVLWRYIQESGDRITLVHIREGKSCISVSNSREKSRCEQTS
jgi:hypothetical protein